MRRQSWLALALIAVVSVASAADKKNKKDKDEEPPTQTLPLLPDPPMAVTADASRLVFETAPLSSKGLLSRQTRDGLKQLLRARHGGTIVKIRAFVAGNGDVRRVQTIVSELFSEKHLPLPALTTVRIGDLPMEGAQVALESITAAKKPVNPHGLAFISGQRGDTLDESINGILNATKDAGAGAGTILKATCFFSSLANAADSRARLASAFPGAALNLMQMQRLPVEPKVNCEAIAALKDAPQAPVRFVAADGTAAPADRSQVALVSTPRLVITGLQLGFKSQPADVRLAFERLGKALESQHASYAEVVLSRIYSMSQPIADSVHQAAIRLFQSRTSACRNVSTAR